MLKLKDFSDSEKSRFLQDFKIKATFSRVRKILGSFIISYMLSEQRERTMKGFGFCKHCKKP